MTELQALVSAILATNVLQVRAILRTSPGVVNLPTGHKPSSLTLAKAKGHKVIETAIARYLGAAHGYSEAELQRVLVDYLHEVIHEYFAAGWMDGQEFEVWGLMHGDPLGPKAAFRHTCVESEQLADLAFLAHQTSCWDRWPEGAANPSPVPLSEWEALYQAWKEEQRLA